MKNMLLTILKGVAMGAADAVPGVSGGTIALVLGVYERLIKALSAFNMDVIKQLLRGNIAAVWKAMDGSFLLQLFLGLAISLVSLLQAVRWSMVNQPILLWAFFLGLVVTSVWYLARKFTWTPQAFLVFPIGLVATASLAFVAPSTTELTLLTALIGGAIAICAMILPGISGSFMLILMGLYMPVSEALHDRNIQIMATFLLGCVLGLLSFSKVLRWLLAQYHTVTMALMTGIIAGATVKLWPWQNWQELQAANDAKTYAVNLWLLPAQYSEQTGEPHHLIAAAVAFFMGAGLILALDVMGRKKRVSNSQS